MQVGGIAYLSRQSFSTSSSRYDQSAAKGPPYFRLGAESAAMLDELVETATDGVVLLIIAIVLSMPLEQSRYTGMPPDPLLVALV